MYSINFHSVPASLLKGARPPLHLRGSASVKWITSVNHMWAVSLCFHELNLTCAFDLELFVYIDPEQLSGLPVYFAPRNTTVS